MKVNFYYCNGTSYVLNSLFGLGFSVDVSGTFRLGDKVLNPNTSVLIGTIVGQNGKTYTSDLAPRNDPFPSMLDPDVWNATKVTYPASMIGIANSVDVGVNNVIGLIQKTPPGQPFGLGGYSQGALVMSQCLKEIQNPGGRLYSRRGDFIGGVMFGNPSRKTNFRGPIGGTFSGSPEVPGSTTGAHGVMPQTGKYARLNTELNGIESKWVDFTAPGDVVSNVSGSDGDGSIGSYFSATAQTVFSTPFTLLPLGFMLTQLAASAVGISAPMVAATQQMLSFAGEVKNFIDVTGVYGGVPGGGHVTYPIWPPSNNDGSYTGLLSSSFIDGTTYYAPAPGMKSCFQMALDWLDSKAREWATAPVVLSSDYTGWSPTLAPPA